jgi:hypothetical protein
VLNGFLWFPSQVITVDYKNKTELVRIFSSLKPYLFVPYMVVEIQQNHLGQVLNCFLWFPCQVITVDYKNKTELVRTFSSLKPEQVNIKP